MSDKDTQIIEEASLILSSHYMVTISKHIKRSTISLYFDAADYALENQSIDADEWGESEQPFCDTSEDTRSRVIKLVLGQCILVMGMVAARPDLEAEKRDKTIKAMSEVRDHIFRVLRSRRKLENLQNIMDFYQVKTAGALKTVIFPDAKRTGDTCEALIEKHFNSISEYGTLLSDYTRALNKALHSRGMEVRAHISYTQDSYQVTSADLKTHRGHAVVFDDLREVKDSVESFVKHVTDNMAPNEVIVSAPTGDVVDADSMSIAITPPSISKSPGSISVSSHREPSLRRPISVTPSIAPSIAPSDTRTLRNVSVSRSSIVRPTSATSSTPSLGSSSVAPVRSLRDVSIRTKTPSISIPAQSICASRRTSMAGSLGAPSISIDRARSVSVSVARR